MGRTFLKYEGLGNDFVVLASDDEASVSPDEARALCDRRRGVGADGVLLVLPPRAPGALARMKVVNADGSVPEMCGNGLRCVALHLARARGTTRAEFVVDTDAGPRACAVEDAAGEGIVTVDMGPTRVRSIRTLDLGDESVEVTMVDTGNPHAVIFGEASVALAERLGPRVEKHASFSRGTNVELARVEGKRVDLVVWERGVGITLACGTGACAAVAAARSLPRCEPIAVHLPGGVLEVTIDKAERATMRGPARFVFSGQLPA